VRRTSRLEQRHVSAEGIMNPLSWWFDYINGARDAHLARLAQWQESVFDSLRVASGAFMPPSESDGPITFAPRADRADGENTPDAPPALPTDGGVERFLSKLVASPRRPSRSRSAAAKPAASL
jgi:hypothetical protein